MGCPAPPAGRAGTMTSESQRGEAGVWHGLASPAPDGRGAIAVVTVAGPEGKLDGVLARVTAGPRVAVGRAGVRALAGVDEGVVARWSARSASIMPHAGPEVVRRVLAALEEAGSARLEGGGAVLMGAAEGVVCGMYPEAGSVVEARMLAALAMAASPRAVDLLLDQPRRWGAGGEATAPGEALRWLLTPATVVAVGRANIGKSTLLNALAGRTVAVAHDGPGTTRDAVGVLVELDGLVVRWLDLPGLDVQAAADPVDREAAALARAACAGADLVVRCCDPARGEVPAAEAGQRAGSWAGRRSLRVGLRADLGAPAAEVDVAVSARTGAGLTELARRVREALVPEAALEHPGAWRFWEG